MQCFLYSSYAGGMSKYNEDNCNNIIYSIFIIGQIINAICMQLIVHCHAEEGSGQNQSSIYVAV